MGLLMPLVLGELSILTCYYHARADTPNSPQALSISPNADPEFGLIQHSLEYDKTALTQSGTECLCLNITVPTESSGSLDAGRQLPVFVFIHGGGFMVGSNAYPQYDMARFVRLSAEIGKPCIAVTIKSGHPPS